MSSLRVREAGSCRQVTGPKRSKSVPKAILTKIVEATEATPAFAITFLQK